MPNIAKITYIENGYFNVKYNIGEVVQDITGIKMTVPTDVAIRECILFMRKIKIDKLTKEFDDNQFRDSVVYKTKRTSDYNWSNGISSRSPC